MLTAKDCVHCVGSLHTSRYLPRMWQYNLSVYIKWKNIKHIGTYIKFCRRVDCNYDGG